MPYSGTVLYRRILREARTFPVGPVRRKVVYNARELFELYKKEDSTEKLRELAEGGESAIRVIAWLKQVPKVYLPS